MSFLDAPKQRPLPNFKPLSRQNSKADHSRSISRNKNNELDHMPLKQLLTSTDFVSRNKKINIEPENIQNNDNDEIIGDQTSFNDTIAPSVSIFNLPGEDEDELRENSITFSDPPHPRFGSNKKKSTSKWTDEETELFFHVVSMCGTDFSMISKFFPKKDRNTISNKFKREFEKKNSSKLQESIKNPKPFDLNLISKIIGVDINSMMDDYHKNKEKLLKIDNNPIKNIPPPENSDLIEDEEFEDIEEEPKIIQPKILNEKIVNKNIKNQNNDEIDGESDFDNF